MTPGQHWAEAEQLLREADTQNSLNSEELIMSARLHFDMAVEGLKLGFPPPPQKEVQDS